jgi:hypothetical protein
MPKVSQLVPILMAIVATTTAAQTNAAATLIEKPLARYTIQQGPENQTLPALPAPCHNDERATEMVRHLCETCDPAEAMAGLGRDRTFKNPPLLLEYAFARIAAGEMTGSYERLVDGVRHCVSWAAADDHNAHIVETLWH